MNKKLITIVGNTLAESQSVFRKGRSIQDHVFTIKQVVEKNRIKNQELYMAFLDLEKAFDRVSQKDIWRSMEQRKIKPNLQKTIKSLYGQNKCYI